MVWHLRTKETEVFALRKIKPGATWDNPGDRLPWYSFCSPSAIHSRVLHQSDQSWVEHMYNLLLLNIQSNFDLVISFHGIKQILFVKFIIQLEGHVISMSSTVLYTHSHLVFVKALGDSVNIASCNLPFICTQNVVGYLCPDGIHNLTESWSLCARFKKITSDPHFFFNLCHELKRTQKVYAQNYKDCWQVGSLRGVFMAVKSLWHWE